MGEHDVIGRGIRSCFDRSSRLLRQLIGMDADAAEPCGEHMLKVDAERRRECMARRREGVVYDLRRRRPVAEPSRLGCRPPVTLNRDAAEVMAEPRLRDPMRLGAEGMARSRQSPGNGRGRHRTRPFLLIQRARPA